MKARYVKDHLRIVISAIALALAIGLSGCGSQATEENAEDEETAGETAADIQDTNAASETGAIQYAAIAEADVTVNDTLENTADGEHAITADGTTDSYANTAVNKTGDSEGDEADFYGENAAIFATNGATLDLKEIVVKTNGAHANGVFSYGEGTTVNVSDSYIETAGNCSGGLMTTGGGTMNAENVTIKTAGNSSAAIRSDRGGGDVNVTKSYATTSGKGSPAIYSTADITVDDSYLESSGSQGVVVEGSNSVTLNNVDMTASNTEKNSDKSSYYQAVMIYQSMSGDAAEGLSSFTMNGGTLTNKKGDIFFVNNTASNISLTNAAITNEDAEGVFLRAAAAGWGKEGSNGGLVTLNASNQKIDGDIVVDDISVLNLYLKDGSSFTGAVTGNEDGTAGEVYVELDGSSTWKLTGDSYVKSLTCDADAVDLNGFKLYVDGKEYEAGTESKGEAIEIEIKESSGKPGEPPEGMNGGAPQGAPGEGGPQGNPPEGMNGEAPQGNPPEGMNGEPPQGAPGEGGPQGGGAPEQPSADEESTSNN